MPNNDAVSGYVRVAGYPNIGSILSVRTMLTDSNGLGDYSYQWSVDGESIVGETASTYQVKDADSSKSISVTVSYQDKMGNDKSIASKNSIPIRESEAADVDSVGNVYIKGVPLFGRELECESNFGDANGIANLSYQWYADGNEIIGATNKAYTPSTHNIGSNIKAVVSYTDGNGNNSQLETRAVEILTSYEIPTSDIQNIDFQIYYDEVTDASYIDVAMQFSDDVKSASFAFLPKSYNVTWWKDLTYNNDTNLFETKVQLPSYQLTDMYYLSLITLEFNDYSITVEDHLLNILGHATESYLDNPHSDNQVPELVSIDMEQVSVDSSSGEFIIPISGKVVDYGGSGFKEKSVEVYLDTPSYNDSYGGEFITTESGDFSGNVRLPMYTRSGDYTISGIAIFDKAGNRITGEEMDNFDSLYGQSVTIVNDNSDSTPPVISSFDMYATFDAELGRPKIVVEGKAEDDLSGFKNAFVRLLGPNGTTYIESSWSHDSDSSLNFKLDIHLLAEYFPGIYSIEDLYVYDNTYNTTYEDDLDFNALGSPTSVNVFFPTAHKDSIVNASESNDYVFDNNDTNDELNAGSGDDQVFSAGGNNSINAGSGRDAIHLISSSVWSGNYNAYNTNTGNGVGTGVHTNLQGLSRYNNIIDGGQGADNLILSGRSDAFFIDDIYSGHHTSVQLITTDDGHKSFARVLDIERIDAGLGNDIVDLTSRRFVLTDNTEIFGGAGNDTIWAANGNDIIDGGSGNDTIFGGSGNDTLIGGTGSDIFQFTATAGNDTITDFSLTDDSIKLYFRDVDNNTVDSLSLDNGVLTWGVDNTNNNVVIDLSNTIASSDTLDDLNVSFVEIV